MPNDLLYDGPQLEGYVYAPEMFPTCENASMKAMAQALFIGVRGKDPEIQP